MSARSLLRLLAIRLPPEDGAMTPRPNRAYGGLRGTDAESTATAAPTPETTATPKPTPKPTPRALVSSLTRAAIADMLQRGDDLLAEASGFADNTPSTAIEAGSLVGGESGPIGSWYVRDRKYQSDLPKLNLNRDPHDLVVAVSDLARFRNVRLFSGCGGIGELQ